MKRLISIILIIILILATLALGYGFYLVSTTQGTRYLSQYLASRSQKAKEVFIGDVTGSFLKGVTYKNVEILELEKLPPGNILKIQELTIKFKSLRLEEAVVDLRNLRVVLPKFEPIIIEGTYKEKLLSATIFGRNIDLKDVVKFFPDIKLPPRVNAQIARIDFKIKGSLEEPNVSGKFIIDKVNYKDFSLINVFGSLNLDINIDKRLLNGFVSLREGTIQGRDTQVLLEESKFLFKNDIKNPSFSLRGISIIDTVTIKIFLGGTVKRPDLRLNSNPPLPPEVLMLMLATGKPWKGLENSFDKGTISPNLARDFIDYFVLGGSGSKLAQQLGIQDIWFTMEGNKKGVGVSKGITKDLSVGYEVEEEKDKQTKTSEVNQKVISDLKITETISVEAEKELQKQTEIESPAPSPADDKILLKYKKNF